MQKQTFQEPIIIGKIASTAAADSNQWLNMTSSPCPTTRVKDNMTFNFSFYEVLCHNDTACTSLIDGWVQHYPKCLYKVKVLRIVLHSHIKMWLSSIMSAVTSSVSVATTVKSSNKTEIPTLSTISAAGFQEVFTKSI